MKLQELQGITTEAGRVMRRVWGRRLKECRVHVCRDHIRPNRPVGNLRPPSSEEERHTLRQVEPELVIVDAVVWADDPQCARAHPGTMACLPSPPNQWLIVSHPSVISLLQILESHRLDPDPLGTSGTTIAVHFPHRWVLLKRRQVTLGPRLTLEVHTSFIRRYTGTGEVGWVTCEGAFNTL